MNNLTKSFEEMNEDERWAWFLSALQHWTEPVQDEDTPPEPRKTNSQLRRQSGCG